MAFVALGVLGHRAANAKKNDADYFLPSTPENLWFGWFPRDMPPALTVPSGAIVKIDTISHRGVGGNGMDPVDFLGQFGVSPEEVLDDVNNAFFNLPPDHRAARGGGGHYLTGPLYVEGAEPGDTLEARIIKIDSRVNYGINAQSSGGALPGYLSQSTVRLMRTNGDVVLFKEGVEIPMKRFQGTMGVAAADDFVSPIASAASVGIVSSTPPGPFGGNMDCNDLGEGTSIYFPVFRTGAQFFTGDPHGVQGNGEVSGNALEQSNTVTIQFILHKGGGLTGPRAETPTHFIMMGIDQDHDTAYSLALADVLDFLQAEKGLSLSDARAFASLAVDFDIAESVDTTQLVMGRIPKRFFVDDFEPKEFWHKPLHVRTEGQRQGLDVFH
jgi:acetamidase/formamidase